MRIFVLTVFLTLMLGGQAIAAENFSIPPGAEIYWSDKDPGFFKESFWYKFKYEGRCYLMHQARGGYSGFESMVEIPCPEKKN